MASETQEEEGEKMIYFGAIPVGVSIAAFMINLIIGSRISAAQAAHQTAAQYDYFRNVSDQQLTQAAFELAREFPQYPYWQWFRLLESMRSYGVIPGPGQETPLPITEVPFQQSKILGMDWYVLALAGVGAFVAYKLL